MIRTRPSPIAALAVLVAGSWRPRHAAASGGGGAGAAAAPDTAAAASRRPTAPAAAPAPSARRTRRRTRRPIRRRPPRRSTPSRTLHRDARDVLRRHRHRPRPAATPRSTVNNFVFLARQGFYDGLTFHRVVAGFVIQGGDPDGTGPAAPATRSTTSCRDDGYPTGSVAMANSGPNTNGSQFFIVTGDGSPAAERLQPFRQGHRGPRRREADRGLRRSQRGPRRSGDPEADPADLHLPGDDHRGIRASASPRRASSSARTSRRRSRSASTRSGTPRGARPAPWDG